MRLVTSGALVSSLTISSTFLPATMSPFCAMYKRAAASICLPVEAKGPVMGKIKPILNLSCAMALPTHTTRVAAVTALKKKRLCMRVSC